jgi:hypothetical protein
MFTLDLHAPAVHHQLHTVYLAAREPVGAAIQPAVIIMIVVAVVLVGGALKQLRRAFAPIGELVRLVFAALTVAVLLVGAVAVLVGGLVLSARGN